MKGLVVIVIAAMSIGCGQSDAPQAAADKAKSAEKAKKAKKAKKTTAGPLLDGPPGEQSAPMPAPVRTPKRTARKRIVLPPPQPPPPRPEGEPKTKADFDTLSTAAAAGTPVDKPGAPPIQRLDAYKYRVGRVFLDRQKRRLEIPARLNMTKGILEYFAVGSRGKLHEAVLELLALPSHIHLALVLVGASVAEQKPPGGGPPNLGSLLRLEVNWIDPKTKKPKSMPAAKLLYDRKSGKAPKSLSWRFQGSRFWKGRYVADMDRSIIGLIPDPTVVVTVGDDLGNPYRGADLGFEVNTAAAPPKGTEMTFVIEVVEKKAPAPR